MPRRPPTAFWADWLILLSAAFCFCSALVWVIAIAHALN
jgi:hypothetical protein